MAAEVRNREGPLGRLLAKLEEYHIPKLRNRRIDSPVRFGSVREALFQRNSWDLYRFRTLLMFFALKVVLPFVDVVSDILTASAFFADGDVVWGSLTIAIVFVPFTIWAISILYQFLMMGPRNDIPTRLWGWLQQLPGFQTLWFLYLFGQLVSIKTSDPRSAAYVRNLKGSGTFNSFSEAFMEAGPQLVLQLSIVYLRGYVGAAQLASLVLGLLSLSFAATTAFFIFREPGDDEPEPPLLWAVAPVCSLYLPVVTVNSLTWALVFVYARGWGALMLVSFLVYGLGAAFVLTRASLKKRGELSGACYTNTMNILVHPTTYIVTAWLAPCVPSRPSIRILLKIGLLSASGLTVLLLTLVPMADQVGDTLEDYPSIFHCLETLPESAVGDETVKPALEGSEYSACLLSEDGSSVSCCGQPAFRVCPLFQSCLSSVRLCGSEKHPLRLLVMVVSVLIVLQQGIVLDLCCLQWLTNYKHFKRLTCGKYVHRSLEESTPDNNEDGSESSDREPNGVPLLEQGNGDAAASG